MKIWMKNLCDNTLISEINLPGTHNSGAMYSDFSFLSKCQNMSISEQLNSGIRFLDIRVEKSGEKLKLVHGIADCKSPTNKRKSLYIEEVIADCERFLSSNPSETILFCLKRDDGASSEETFDLFFNKYFSNDTLWYKENRVPTLKDARGKIILLNRFSISKDNDSYNDFNTGINLSNWVYQKDNVEKIYEVAELLGRNGTLTGKTFSVQDLYGLSPKKKWDFAIAPFIKKPPEEKGILISFFSCTSSFNPPKKSAEHINKKLSDITFEKTKKYGWIIMDYPTDKVIKNIINSNF